MFCQLGDNAAGWLFIEGYTLNYFSAPKIALSWSIHKFSPKLPVTDESNWVLQLVAVKARKRRFPRAPTQSLPWLRPDSKPPWKVTPATENPPGYQKSSRSFERQEVLPEKLTPFPRGEEIPLQEGQHPPLHFQLNEEALAGPSWRCQPLGSENQIWVPVLPPTHWLIMANLFNFFVPQFPHPQIGMIVSHKVAGRTTQDAACKDKGFGKGMGNVNSSYGAGFCLPSFLFPD